MQTSIQLEFYGDQELAKLFASALAATRGSEVEEGLSIDWKTPGVSLGMTQSTVELLGLLGVISLPISILASVIANLMTRSVGRAKSEVVKSAPQKERLIRDIALLIVVSRDEVSAECEIRLSQSESEIRIAITDAVKRLPDET